MRWGVKATGPMGSSACKSQGVAVTLVASRENVTQTDPLPRFHGEALYQRL